MIGAGISVIDAFTNLSEYLNDANLRHIAKDIQQCLVKGESLSVALSRSPKLFPKWHVDIIQYSEVSGKLSQGTSDLSLRLSDNTSLAAKLILEAFLLYRLA